MPLRPGPSAAHQQAVARRLALLDAELGAVRPAATPADADPATVEHPWVVRHRERTAAPEPWDPLPDDEGGAHTRPRAVRSTHPGPHAEPHAESRPGSPPESHAEWHPAGDPVPRPGRHASGRAGAPVDRGGELGARLGALVPEGLRGRAGLGAAQLGAVALLVGVALAVTAWWTVRSEPEPLPPAAPVGALVTPGAAASDVAVGEEPGPAGPDASGEPGASPTGQQQEVVVDVAGKVRRPGIAVLPAGSRVVDAIEAAGGARPGVDLASLNLARVLVDGEQILVGHPGVGSTGAVPPTPGSPGAPTVPGAPSALVDLNTADLTLLDTLPGVGPVTAQAIVDWRTENGGFTAVDDLLDVSGIGEVTLAELTPLVTV